MNPKNLTSVTGAAVLIEVDKIVDQAEAIMTKLPNEYARAKDMAVMMPPMDGYCIYGNRSIFGRRRWWDQRGNEFCYFLKPTAPNALQEWENHVDLPYFLQLLNLLQPGPLSEDLGSNLAALQIIVDVIDHLMCNQRIPLSALSSSIAAHLTSATLLLSWPSEFLESGMILHKWRRENVTPGRVEPISLKCLLKYWERCVKTSLPSLETACHLRTQMQCLLRKLIADPPPPSLPTPLASINACIVANSGSSTELNDLVSVAELSKVRVKVYLNKRKEPEPLIDVDIKKSP